MNRSFRAEDLGPRQRQPLMGSIRSSDEELSLFLEMRRREKERNSDLFLEKPNEFDPLGSKAGNTSAAAPVRKTRTDEFLNADNDKTDYDWLLTPPGTPLFPSLEMESQKNMRSPLGTSKAQPTSLRSRLTNPLPEATARSNLSSKQLATSTPGLNTSSSSLRRPSSSGGSRPSTPTGRPTLSSSKSTLTSASRPTSTSTSKIMSNTTSSRSSRSATPTSRATAKPAVPPRSSTPTARSSARSSTPTRAPITGPKTTSRPATPTRRPTSVSSSTNSTNTTVPRATTAPRNPLAAPRNPAAAPRASSPTVKPRPWKPSDMPGFSHDTPPNLRTSLADRPVSATRGRPGGASRSSSVEPASNGRIRRQSCSPSRGRPPNGIMHSSGSSVPVPSMSRLHAKARDNVSPGMVGTKMVERVINMRKLVPPKQDDKHSPHSNLSTKSSSPDSSGFGRSFSKKSLDMAIRHMDIRQRIPGNLRPLMTNIPASSMYSVRSGPSRSRTVSVPDSPLATSSNASSEVSFSNNAVYVDGSEIDDDISSDKGGARSPASVRGR